MSIFNRFLKTYQLSVTLSIRQPQVETLIKPLVFPHAGRKHLIVRVTAESGLHEGISPEVQLNLASPTLTLNFTSPYILILRPAALLLCRDCHTAFQSSLHFIVNMSESGHPFLPLIPSDPYLRLNWEQEGDVGDARSSLSTVHTESRPQSAASHFSTASTASQPMVTTNAPSAAQQIDEQSAGSTSKSPSFLGKFRQWQWKFEIMLVLLSICALLAIIVLLAVKDGVPLESWDFYLSLNTIISVLGTISRSSLASAVGSCLAQEKWNWFRKRQDHLYIFDRIDNASRGPMGSFKLLFWMRF